MNGWGGKREGAGRQKIDSKERKQRQFRLAVDEWELMRDFDKILKYGDYQAAKDFVEQFKVNK